MLARRLAGEMSSAKRRRLSQTRQEQYAGPGMVVTAETDVLRGHGTYEREGRLLSSVSGTLERINKLIAVLPCKSRSATALPCICCCAFLNGANS
eukprot:COSAG05_NODE_54_length_23549_cov_81.790840_12_plen_95_part_00